METIPDTWITDTVTSERFPILSRANADEVSPDPLAPLSWSLAWELGASIGVAEMWVDIGALRAEELRRPIPETFGCWGSYLYNQISIPRVYNVRSPSSSIEVHERSFIGANALVPDYVADPRDLDPELTARLGQTYQQALHAQDLPELKQLIGRVDQIRASRPKHVDLDNVGLVRHAREMTRELATAWRVFSQITICSAIGPNVAHEICDQLGAPEDVMAGFTSIGDVSSADISTAIWELSRIVRRSSTLTAQFDLGRSGLLDRIQNTSDPNAALFIRRFEQLIERHGHRGPNEWCLMSATSELDPELSLRLVDAVRVQTDDASPQARAAESSRLAAIAVARTMDALHDQPDQRRLLQSAFESGRTYYRAREVAKDLTVWLMNEIRTPMRELGRRAVTAGALNQISDVFMLVDSELDTFVRDPQLWRSILAARACMIEAFRELEPPYAIVHETPIPPIRLWPRRSHSVHVDARPGLSSGGVQPWQGTGASPGRAIGPARVFATLADVDRLEPGDILVCGGTDPGWIPLFMLAGAVVCEVGGQASHAAIVCRELGVPCVVGVPGARSKIADGTLLVVNGDRGTVGVTS